MDIERLKRLNQLAGELKTQGIAGDRQDAAYLANAMVGQEPEKVLSTIRISENQSMVAEQIIQNNPVPEQVPEQPTQQLLVAEQPMQLSVSKQEVESVLQAFANQLSHEVAQLRNQLQQSNAQISALQNKLSKLSQSENTDTAQTTLTSAVETADSPHEITSADVSVEKMFYYGNH